jgi:AraC-like DNA-binding protein
MPKWHFLIRKCLFPITNSTFLIIYPRAAELFATVLNHASGRHLSVAAFLPTRLLTHIKHVFADEPELFIAESWQELESIIRRKPISVVILDPAADGIMNVGAVASLLKRYPSLPLIAYVTLHAPQFNAVAQLGRLGLKEVVLHRFDDAPEGFRERVERVEGNALTHDVIEALRDRLGHLPRQLSVAVENLFEQPHRYTSALDLAMEAGVAIVSVYRNLDAGHLGSPKRLLIAAKVLRGFGYLRDPGYSVLDVSIKLGYKTARIFSQHWVSVFGLTPARVRTRLTDAAAIESVLRWLGAGDDDDLSLADDPGHPPGHNGSRLRRRRKERS